MNQKWNDTKIYDNDLSRWYFQTDISNFSRVTKFLSSKKSAYGRALQHAYCESFYEISCLSSSNKTILILTDKQLFAPYYSKDESPLNVNLHPPPGKKRRTKHYFV